jgi:very-short-patch-repair endonuclease
MAWGRGNPLLGYWQRLYDDMTPAEVALEPAIAALGERYRSQHPFWGLKHFADFALLDRKLIIEVDGSSHNTPSQKKKDLEHTLALKSLGWEVVRVSNEQAQAVPAETVAWCLRATPQTTEQLQTALARLKAEHPALFEPKPTKSRKPRRKAKAAQPKLGAARRKPPAA